MENKIAQVSLMLISKEPIGFHNHEQRIDLKSQA